MADLNVLIAGEKNSGKSTFASALKLTKFNSYNFNIIDGFGSDIKLIDKKQIDIVFYLFDVENIKLYETDKFYEIDKFVDFIEDLATCLIIPVFNKLDIIDFSVDNQTNDIIFENKENISGLLELLKEKSKQNPTVVIFDEICICSAEFALAYLHMSNCNKTNANSDLKIVSKIGQYELGKQQWNKKTASEKASYAVIICEKLKKQSVLNTVLFSVGYNINKIVFQSLTDELKVNFISKYFDHFLHCEFKLISTDIFNLFTYIFENIKTFEKYWEQLSIVNELYTTCLKHITEYDYSKLNFENKSILLTLLKTKKSEIVNEPKILSKNEIQLTELIDNIATQLSDTLSNEFETQLKMCISFQELILKLYDYFDLNDNILVDQILLNHPTLKSILFNNTELKSNIEFLETRFDIDMTHFLLKIMEMKLDTLFEETSHAGKIETMIIVSYFFDEHPKLIKHVPELKQYKMLLQCGIMKQIQLCDKKILIEKNNDKNKLFVENKYYNLVCSENSAQSSDSEKTPAKSKSK